MNIKRLLVWLLAAAMLCGTFAGPAAADGLMPALPDLSGVRSALLKGLADEYVAALISPDADPMFREAFSYEIGEPVMDENSAEIPVTLRGLDIDALSSDIAESMQASIAAAVEAASISSEIYNEELSLLPELADSYYEQALADIDLNGYMTETTYALKAEFDYDSAEISADTDIADSIKLLSGSSATLRDSAFALLEYVRKHYTAEIDNYVCPVPNPDNFGITDDPAVLAALLETPIAQQLLDGRELSWSPEIELFPNSQIRYYLDETVLVIVWQEVTTQAVGTYAEIIIADGTQLGRKIVDDTYGSTNYCKGTTLAAQTGCIVAISGDLYAHHSRHNGIGVFEGTVYRFEPKSSDTMYFDYDGRMYFTLREEFSTIEEAQAFVDENNISFSVSFGPLMVDNYENVTPKNYQWGEIYDRYARCAIGEIDDNHYLACTINCGRGIYNHLVQIFDARNAMMEHGCRSAYALDGGQTASIIFNGELINPVQFGRERLTSDIIYFTTALPSYEAPEE